MKVYLFIYALLLPSITFAAPKTDNCVETSRTLFRWNKKTKSKPTDPEIKTLAKGPMAIRFLADFSHFLGYGRNGSSRLEDNELYKSLESKLGNLAQHLNPEENPFLNEEDKIDFQKLSDRLYSLLSLLERSETSYSVIGGRNTGKTSFIYQLLEKNSKSAKLSYVTSTANPTVYLPGKDIASYNSETAVSYKKAFGKNKMVVSKDAQDEEGILFEQNESNSKLNIVVSANAKYIKSAFIDTVPFVNRIQNIDSVKSSIVNSEEVFFVINESTELEPELLRQIYKESTGAKKTYFIFSQKESVVPDNAIISLLSKSISQVFQGFERNQIEELFGGAYIFSATDKSPKLAGNISIAVGSKDQLTLKTKKSIQDSILESENSFAESKAKNLELSLRNLDEIGQKALRKIIEYDLRLAVFREMIGNFSEYNSNLFIKEVFKGRNINNIINGYGPTFGHSLRQFFEIASLVSRSFFSTRARTDLKTKLAQDQAKNAFQLRGLFGLGRKKQKTSIIPSEGSQDSNLPSVKGEENKEVLVINQQTESETIKSKKKAPNKTDFQKASIRLLDSVSSYEKEKAQGMLDEIANAISSQYDRFETFLFSKEDADFAKFFPSDKKIIAMKKEMFQTIGLTWSESDDEIESIKESILANRMAIKNLVFPHRSENSSKEFFAKSEEKIVDVIGTLNKRAYLNDIHKQISEQNDFHGKLFNFVALDNKGVFNNIRWVVTVYNVLTVMKLALETTGWGGPVLTALNPILDHIFIDGVYDNIGSIGALLGTEYLRFSYKGRMTRAKIYEEIRPGLESASKEAYEQLGNNLIEDLKMLRDREVNQGLKESYQTLIEMLNATQSLRNISDSEEKIKMLVKIENENFRYMDQIQETVEVIRKK